MVEPQYFTYNGQKTIYAPFTPSHCGQHLSPPFYRGCWHEISRDFFLKACHYLLIT